MCYHATGNDHDHVWYIQTYRLETLFSTFHGNKSVIPTQVLL